ncbi:PTS mannose transporter subunit IIA [Endozoicomonas sp. (ex Bugula neritina AB1)]|nr:PTS mannose transporter subunit IIA [Endozoicomonas sp. (ex Bugula neritina AB1)]
MIGVVVTGHLNFATGYRSALLAIAGDEPQVEYVDFLESMSTNDLEQALRLAVDKVDTGDGVLFLTDITGGSPFQQSVKVAADIANADVISGTNLVMVAEALMEREDLAITDLVSQLIETGMENIKSYYQETQHASCSTSNHDGI